jgi:hypothetical protein
MRLDRDRPEILKPPGHLQGACAQQTITVPPGVNAKTRQKHDYPSPAWRRSYARRTGAERGFSTAKDPASNDIARGWCRLMGLAPLMLFVTTLVIVRNRRILHAWDARQEGNARRAARGLPPKTRKRHRKTPAALATGPPWAAREQHPHSTAGNRPAAERTAAACPQTVLHSQKDTKRTRNKHAKVAASMRARMPDPNVKIGLTET